MARSRSGSGVIGCGFYAQNHLHAWRDLAPEGAELAAVCDVDAAKAEAAGRAFGVPCYTDAATMLDRERLDAGRHRDPAGHAPRAGARLTIAQRRRDDRAEAVRADLGGLRGDRRGGDGGRRLARGARELPLPGADAAACGRLIDKGAIGAPSWARIALPHRLRRLRDPALFPDRGAARHRRCRHPRARPRALLPRRGRRASPARRSGATRRSRGEDTATMLLRHESGAVSVVECTYEARRQPDPLPRDAARDRGRRAARIVVDRRAAGMTVTSDRRGRARTTSARRCCRGPAHPWHVSQEGALGACRHFLACLRAGAPAETERDGQSRDLRAGRCRLCAAETGRAVAPQRWVGVGG